MGSSPLIIETGVQGPEHDSMCSSTCKSDLSSVSNAVRNQPIGDSPPSKNRPGAKRLRAEMLEPVGALKRRRLRGKQSAPRVGDLELALQSCLSEPVDLVLQRRRPKQPEETRQQTRQEHTRPADTTLPRESGRSNARTDQLGPQALQ